MEFQYTLNFEYLDMVKQAIVTETWDCRDVIPCSSEEALINLINHIRDYSEQTNGYPITFYMSNYDRGNYEITLYSNQLKEHIRKLLEYD